MKKKVKFGSYEVDADLHAAWKALCDHNETSLYKVMIRHMKIDVATGKIPTIDDVERVVPTQPSVPTLLVGKKRSKQPGVAV